MLTSPLPRPELQRCEVDGIVVWIDPNLAQRGILIGFTERAGGVSVAPYDSLNLAGHVGDDPEAVARNRGKLLSSLNLDDATPVHVPQQVHGLDILAVPPEGDAPLIGDGLITAEPDRMLLLCFADCVPIVLVAPSGELAVLHAGWRGVIGGIAGEGVRRLSEVASCDPRSLNVYIGAHIGVESYPVDSALASRFSQAFYETVIDETEGLPRLDLEAAVLIDLERATVDPARTVHLGIDTAQAADRFFSYRDSGGTTGRHAAFALRRSTL